MAYFLTEFHHVHSPRNILNFCVHDQGYLKTTYYYNNIYVNGFKVKSFVHCEIYSHYEKSIDLMRQDLYVTFFSVIHHVHIHMFVL